MRIRRSRTIAGCAAWALALAALLSPPAVLAQTVPPPTVPGEQAPLPDSPGTVLHPGPEAAKTAAHGAEAAEREALRHDPSQPQSVIAAAQFGFASDGTSPKPCRTSHWFLRESDHADAPDEPLREACISSLNPYARFLNTRMSIPMSPKQKGYLAFRNLSDPFNLGTIVAASGITIAVDSHSAYGPAWRGFGKLAGVSLLQDATGEFFGTFLIPSITHEDPHYHRMPQASIKRRLLHAVSRTVIAQHDDGSPMPNYATLLTYPIAAEISNLYVPGISGNGPSTAARIATGLALDPVNNLITEFLPDVASRVHIRIIFVQQILNQVVRGEAAGGVASAPQ